MQKDEKYKILYAKVKDVPGIPINKKLYRFFSYNHFLNKSKNLINKEIMKNSRSLEQTTFRKTKNFSSNTLKVMENKTQNNSNNGLMIYKFSKMSKRNKKPLYNITYSLDELILNDMNSIPNKFNNKNYLTHNCKNKNKITHLMARNNTENIFTNLRIIKSKIPMIKPKKLLLMNLKKNNMLYKISKNENENTMNNYFESYENKITNIFKFKNNILNKFNYIIKSNDNNLYNEIKKKNITIYNISNKIYRSYDFNNNIFGQYYNDTEINHTLFIALNNLTKHFVTKILDNYITNEEIKPLFNIKNIIKEFTNINIEGNIYIYLKEFLLYLYLSNYINLYYSEFCISLYKMIEKEVFIDINKIFSIYLFRNLLYDIKSIFDSLKSIKKYMVEKLIDNYNKNEKKISFATFILFLAYNRNNFRTIFHKELLFDLLNTIDINFNLDNINNGFTAEQYVKFKLLLTKNELINEEMKKKLIKKFFNYSVFNNNDYDKKIYVIKLRHIFNNSENIMKIANKGDLEDSFLSDSYNKFIDHFNF